MLALQPPLNPVSQQEQCSLTVRLCWTCTSLRGSIQYAWEYIHEHVMTSVPLLQHDYNHVYSCIFYTCTLHFNIRFPCLRALLTGVMFGGFSRAHFGVTVYWLCSCLAPELLQMRGSKSSVRWKLSWLTIARPQKIDFLWEKAISSTPFRGGKHHFESARDCDFPFFFNFSLSR